MSSDQAALPMLHPELRVSGGPRVRRAPRHVSFRPTSSALAKAFGHTQPDIVAKATDRWEVAPASRMEVRPAKMLPGQLERIERAEFSTLQELRAHLQGGYASVEPATVAYRLRDVLLDDGVLYASGAVRHLRARSKRFSPAIRAVREYAIASLYESWSSNRWFGMWLKDDCLTYRLAEETGLPFTAVAAIGHMSDYERRLAMWPERSESAWFGELILFDDTSNNEHKRGRADDMRRRLISDPLEQHPGVFLLRGSAGEPRILVNELEIAERLAVRRGFQVLDPLSTSVQDIVRACSGARVVAGVEGSHLVHGLVAMPNDASAFVILPPLRGASELKYVTDRQGQDYAQVVGEQTEDGFVASLDEIERTLDLLNT